MNKIVLITGATSGIGKASAIEFAKNGANLILTGRRKERLESIAAQITKHSGVKVVTLCFDIRKRTEVENAIASLGPEWQNIDILVNNAGLALGLSPIQDGDVDNWEAMIDTNIKGLLFISRAVMPLMIKRGKGHIINIGSIAGRETYFNGNIYCGTKHAVNSLTKAMRIDLLKHGIKVTQVAPGAVETEFSIVRYKGDVNKAKNVYKGYKPLEPEDVAGVIHYVSTLPQHVNINDVLVMPTAQAASGVFHKTD